MNDSAVTGFDGISADDRRTVIGVTALSLAVFVIETLAGQVAGSQSLKADALGFFAVGISCALSLWLIGRPEAVRSAAAIVKATSLLAMGLWVGATTLYHFFVSAVPDPGFMGYIGFLALAANAFIIWLLFRHRDGDMRLRSIWLSSRNGSIGNGAVIIGASLVALVNSGSPDLIVAGVMAALFLTSAVPSMRQALDKWRELKEADGFPKGHDHSGGDQ